jgi:hypothetical protein
LGNIDRWATWETAGLNDLLDEGKTRTGFRCGSPTPIRMNTNIVATMNVDHLKETSPSPPDRCPRTPKPRPRCAWAPVLGHVDEYLSDCAILNCLVGVCCVCEREPVQRQTGVFTDRQRSVL